MNCLLHYFFSPMQYPSPFPPFAWRGTEHFGFLSFLHRSTFLCDSEIGIPYRCGNHLGNKRARLKGNDSTSACYIPCPWPNVLHTLSSFNTSKRCQPVLDKPVMQMRFLSSSSCSARRKSNIGQNGGADRSPVWSVEGPFGEVIGWRGWFREIRGADHWRGVVKREGFVNGWARMWRSVSGDGQMWCDDSCGPQSPLWCDVVFVGGKF